MASGSESCRLAATFCVELLSRKGFLLSIPHWSTTLIPALQTEEPRMAKLTRRELLELTVVTGGVVAAEQLLPGGVPTAAAQTAAAPALQDLTLRVNGSEHRLSLDPRTTLLDALREHLRLTGSKKGCGLGQCG